MAVESTMIPLGTKMPQFSLLDVVSGEQVTSMSLAGAPALVAVICNHCPYVKRIKSQLADFARDWMNQGIRVIAVSANDATTHPEDGPEPMKADAQTYSYPFPYLYDADQELVAALQAMCTPEFYLFNEESALVYRGRLDDSTPGNGKSVTGADLKRAVQALLAGAPAIAPQLPSMGCSVKWKSDRLPEYARQL
jgi:thiol-disulfide isomerase/thioredoxin